MLDDREFEGFWWLPSDPENRLPGTLKFSQEAVRLELLGSFVPGALPLTELDHQPRILGVTTGQKAITLEGCQSLGVAGGLVGIVTSSYVPNIVLHGLWYEPDEEVRFDEISIRYSDLDTWAMTSGFTFQWFHDAEGKSLSKLDISYTPPPAIEVALDRDTTLKIAFSWTWHGMRVPTTDVRVTQAASFRVAFATPASVDEALDFVYHLRNFLSVGVGRPIRVLSVHGFQNPPPDAEADPLTRLELQRLDVEILYRLVGVPSEPARELHPTEMLFTLGDALPRLEEICQNWFKRQEVLREVFARYFYIVHGQPPDRDHAFESYVRVLETHHRRTAAEAVSAEETQERVARIVTHVVPDSDREWLQDELAFSHEPSLSQRLNHTLSRCATVARNVIGNSRQRTRFMWKVVKTRNYLTHLDPAQKRGAGRGDELLVLVFQLRALVEMTLLLELGFDCEEIDAIFERTRRYELINDLRARS